MTLAISSTRGTPSAVLLEVFVHDCRSVGPCRVLHMGDESLSRRVLKLSRVWTRSAAMPFQQECRPLVVTHPSYRKHQLRGANISTESCKNPSEGFAPFELASARLSPKLRLWIPSGLSAIASLSLFFLLLET